LRDDLLCENLLTNRDNWLNANHTVAIKVTEPMVYHIPSGVPITAIANNLEEQGIIRSSFFVRVMVKVNFCVMICCVKIFSPIEITG
jgi:cell division protein YceG involved in septum cleavage